MKSTLSREVVVAKGPRAAFRGRMKGPTIIWHRKSGQTSPGPAWGSGRSAPWRGFNLRRPKVGSGDIDFAPEHGLIIARSPRGTLNEVRGGRGERRPTGDMPRARGR